MLLNDLLALVKEALMADVLVMVSSPLPLLVIFMVWVVLVHMPGSVLNDNLVCGNACSSPC